jgi:Zn finger protein HypA/HybF involved in hydrogenase expression
MSNGSIADSSLKSECQLILDEIELEICSKCNTASNELFFSARNSNNLICPKCATIERQNAIELRCEACKSAKSVIIPQEKKNYLNYEFDGLCRFSADIKEFGREAIECNACDGRFGSKRAYCKHVFGCVVMQIRACAKRG